MHTDYPLDNDYSVGPYVFEIKWINQTVGWPLQHIHLMTTVPDSNYPGKLFWAIHTFYELKTSKDSRRLGFFPFPGQMCFQHTSETRDNLKHRMSWKCSSKEKHTIRPS